MGWHEDTTLESIHLETGGAVDDLRAINSLGANARIQAKLSLRLSAAPESELAKVLDSFVEQYLTDGKPDPRFSNSDLLVLAVGPPASKQIRERLPFVLERVIGLPAGEPIEGLDFAAADKAVLETVTAHVSRAWRARTGTAPSEEELGRQRQHLGPRRSQQPRPAIRRSGRIPGQIRLERSRRRAVQPLLAGELDQRWRRRSLDLRHRQ
jgi:hypothetical protein